MRAYIIRRLLLAIPTLWLASLIIFFTIRLIPGDIIDLMVSEMQVFSEMDRAAVEHAMGLDVPVLIQYGHWIGDIALHGDFGNSLWSGAPVTSEVLSRWPVTLELGILGLIISQLIALPIGAYSALRQDAIGDYVGRSFAIGCIAVPNFWLATMIVVFPAIWWNWSPPMILIPFNEDPIGNLKMFIIPAVVLGMQLSGITMRMTRTMMLEVLKQDYIRTAWAKGLSERIVVIRHALKNTLIPVITTVGIQVPILVGGTVVIETVFCLPGMGRLLVDSIVLRDYPIVFGVMVLFGVATMLINLMVDITYAFLDPRIRYK